MRTIFTSFRDMAMWMKDWERSYQAEARSAYDQFVLEIKFKLRSLVAERLPSGGGSYLDSFVSRSYSAGDNTLVYEVTTLHQWGKLIETGSEDHPIPVGDLGYMYLDVGLPGSEGKGTPWGTRYVNVNARVEEDLIHPGARGFKIFESAYNWAKRNINPNNKGSVIHRIIKDMGFQ